MKENIHQGHRKRLRAKYVRGGLESFGDVEALEFLLTFAIPRRDTNAVAHHLLERFRNFQGVMEAQREELLKVEGIGEQAALLLTLVPGLHRRYLKGESFGNTTVRGSDSAGSLLCATYAYERQELVMLLCLDARGRLLACKELKRGSISSVLLSAETIVDAAVAEKSARIILAHNHPSGIALPSEKDKYATEQLWQALQLVGVELVDHLIFAREDFVSMRDSGYFKNAE